MVPADASSEEARAIMPVTYPNFPAGAGQMALVRTANPQEYKPEGNTVRVQGFSKHPVVHACIRAVADIVASIPFVVLTERGNSESKVPASHPLQRLLDYPGPRMTARAMRARLAVDYMGYGNAMFQMERPGPTRPPIALRSINPESLQSVWVDTEGDPRRYDYGNWSGVIVTVPAEDVLHFRDLDMPRPFFPDVFGFPRGATAIASMTADNEATTYVRQVVTNDGTPTFAVLLSDEASQDDATAMQDRYRARVVDRGKRGTPAFFGAVRDIKPLGFTLRDLEFPDLRRVSREDICAAFGVDPRMIGIASATSDAGLSGAQYVEARARLVQHTIEPIMVSIIDEMNHWLAPEFGDVWVEFDHDVMRDLVEDDAATSKRVQEEWKASLRTWEESRRALRLPPLPVPTDTMALTTGTTLVPAATAVIDPAAIADATAGAGVAAALPAGTGDIQSTALNGAQTTALVEMLQLATTKALPIQTVEALIQASFPGVSAELIAQMLGGVATYEAPATDNEPAPGPGPEATEDEMAEMEAEEDEAGQEDEEEGGDIERADLTNFPAKGDNKKVSLRNSQWGLFPVAEADALKKEWPALWRKGGNIRGNRQFQLLAPIAKRGGVPDGLSEERAVRLREAWGARHGRNTRLAGVVAQIKWLVVGDQGLPFMRQVIKEAKEKQKARLRSHLQEHLATRQEKVPAGTLTGDQLKAVYELLEAVVEGELPRQTVESLLLAAFPILDEDLVLSMLDALEDFEPEEEEEPEEEPQEEPEDEMPEAPALEASTPWWQQMSREALEADPRFQYWQRAVKEMDASEPAFAAKAKDRFAKERADMPRQFGLDQRAYKTTKQILEEIDRRIREDYAPGGEYYNAWRAAFEDLVGAMYMTGAKQIAGVGLSFSLQSPEVLEAITRRTSRLAELIGETTAKEVTAAIRAAELAGFSVAETARLVQATVFNERITDNRAKTIARTESAGAMSQGSWDQGRAMGIYQSKEWLAFEDDKTRDSHIDCMGQGRIPIDEPFQNGLMYPLDPSGDWPQEVINCRCVLAEYVTTADEEPI